MKITYFPDTDTLLVTLSENPVVETTDINEDVLVDLDGTGKVVSITLEHAAQQTDVNEFSYRLAAGQS